MMQNVKKVGKIFLWSLLFLIILYNLYTFASFKIFKKNLVGIGGYASLEVVSGSMEFKQEISLLSTKRKRIIKKAILSLLWMSMALLLLTGL